MPNYSKYILTLFKDYKKLTEKNFLKKHNQKGLEIVKREQNKLNHEQIIDSYGT